MKKPNSGSGERKSSKLVSSSSGRGSVLIADSSTVAKHIKSTNRSSNSSGSLKWIKKFDETEPIPPPQEHPQNKISDQEIESKEEDEQIDEWTEPTLEVGNENDCMEKYRTEYQLLTQRVQILSQTVEASQRKLESIQEKIREKNGKLDRLKLSHTEVEQKLLFYKSQKLKLETEIEQESQSVEQLNKDSQSETSNLDITMETLQVLKKNQLRTKEHLQVLVTQAQQQIEKIMNHLQV